MESWIIVCNSNRYYSKSGRFTLNLAEAFCFASYKAAYHTYKRFCSFDINNKYAIVKGYRLLKAA